ncbi:VWA domain-containing protein [Aquabacterium sp. J223]|uniref:vWA domain-containing protein n=1 Tax=Aquabacterium sp. J223 TaxID=2898431 RepID=UPI0021ADC19E|nr:VWA domain-containing protein [Aquabacterium sp. J223]UUX95074.1 VWA domain-containing protein [Aquabacterium sp. J223]
MHFLWPSLLWLALLLPVLALPWGLARWRRRRGLGLHPGFVAIADRSRVRWLAAGLWGLALVLAVVAAARPTARLTLLMPEQTVLLVMDVSGSMRAKDILPTRMEASQAAAQAFVAGLPRATRVGVVAYGEVAHLVQAPTPTRSAVQEAIARLKLQRGTAIGSGLALALATLYPKDEVTLALESIRTDDDLPRAAGAPRPAPVSAEPPAVLDDSVAIVLLTDGENTIGPNPVRMARWAAKKGVRIYTVGFGTRSGAVVTLDGGLEVKVSLDEPTLQQMARLTGGEYFHAENQVRLDRVYRTLGQRLVAQRRETELTGLFAAAAALGVLAAAGLSLWRFGRIL